MATYYVTQAGTGDGTSYANACSVAELNANTHFTPAADDIIYLCDAITSTVVPPTSGTGGHLITYRGDYADHAGVINATGLTYGVHVSIKDYVKVLNITVFGANDYGIRLRRANYCTVTGCTVRNMGAPNDAYPCEGIMIDSGSNNTISYNTVYEIGRHGIDVSVFDTYTSSGNIVEHNTIYNCYHSGIDSNNLGTAGVAVLSGNIYRYNHIYANSSYSDFTKNCNGIYMEGNSATQASDASQIYYNVIHDLPGKGIQIYNYVTNAVIYNNTVANKNSSYATATSGIAVSDTGISGTIVKNNISTGYDDGAFWSAAAASCSSVENNAWYAAGANKFVIVGASHWHSDEQAAYKAATGWDDTGLWEDPLLASATDFHLQATSPCRNKGVWVSLTSDYEGTIVPQGEYPDIGAYEYPVSGAGLAGEGNIPSVPSIESIPSIGNRRK